MQRYTLVSTEGVLTTIFWEDGKPVLHHVRAVPSFQKDSSNPVMTRPYMAMSYSEAWLLKQKLLEFGYDYQIVPYFDEAICEAFNAIRVSSSTVPNLFARLNAFRLLWLRSGQFTQSPEAPKT